MPQERHKSPVRAQRKVKSHLVAEIQKVCIKEVNFKLGYDRELNIWPKGKKALQEAEYKQRFGQLQFA